MPTVGGHGHQVEGAAVDPLILVRPDDHVILGVSWVGATVVTSTSGPVLQAGDGARLMLTLPPQHVGEETTLAGSAPPNTVTLSGSGTSVPVWRGVLAAPTRLIFALTPQQRVPLTVDGVLAAAAENPLILPPGAPGADDTAIELPWRLIIAPRGQSGSAAVCRHSDAPTGSSANGLWRTRIVDGRAPVDATLLDAQLLITAPDGPTASTTDPDFGGNRLPLGQSERQSIVANTAVAPAPVTRLELSSLGGTLSARAVWADFEWEHRAVLGRDMHVRTLAKGALYPLGHRAQYLQISHRVENSALGGVSALQSINVLTIVDPVRAAAPDGPVRRAFPLGDVTLTRTVYDDLDNAQWIPFPRPGAAIPNPDAYFWPTSAGAKVAFPVTCTSASGDDVKLVLPLLFVKDQSESGWPSLTDPALAQRLAAAYATVDVDLPPTNIDLVGAPPVHSSGFTARERRADAPTVTADVHEVHGLTIGGVADHLADGYRARLDKFIVALPALRVLQRTQQDIRTTVTFAQDYLKNGVSEDVLLHMLPAGAVPVDFSAIADRSGGLLAPKYLTNAISRTLGPIDLNSLPDPLTGNIDVASLFPTDDATLLGFPLRTLLSELKVPPQITSIPIPTAAPRVQMTWANVKLQSMGPLKAQPDTALDHLTVTVAPDGSSTDCMVRDIVLELPAGDPVLRLSFAAITFTQSGGQSPTVKVSGVKAEFVGSLALLQDLQDLVDFDDPSDGAVSKLAKYVDVSPTGVTVHYTQPIPSVSSGVFTMRNLAFTATVDVPFDRRPLSISLAFASRATPFALAVMMFGGTGYIELEMNRSGIKRFEAALEFGAFVAVDFVVASGEVHALGGVRFVLATVDDDQTVTITGYLRIGGSVEVLGLISVSIELCLSLTYTSERNALVGRATLVIEIDLTLWSDSVELDSGEWVLAGSSGTHHRHLFTAGPDPQALYAAYRACFADLPTSAGAVTPFGGGDE